MEEDIEPTEYEIRGEPMLQLFKYKHLTTPSLRAVSREFCRLAQLLVSDVPRNQERTASLRKLREAKDCAVTAMFWAVTA